MNDSIKYSELISKLEKARFKTGLKDPIVSISSFINDTEFFKGIIEINTTKTLQEAPIKGIDILINKALLLYESVPIKKRTNEDRLSAIGNIYFIHCNDILVYIGQRKASSIKTRLDQHLFGKSYKVDERNVQCGTISKWDKVSNEIKKGNTITFKSILIQPDSLRTTIEEELIHRLKPDWNIHAK